MSVMLMLSLIASAQPASEVQVKAAYVYNFAKFVEWPSQTPNSPLRFCVLNDPPFYEELGRIVKGRSISGHSIEVVQVQDGEQSRRCQVLFINPARDQETPHILGILHGKSVLTIGETSAFLDQGGIINFVAEDEHIYFEVNHKAATATGLYISSRLLGVAKRVIE